MEKYKIKAAGAQAKTAFKTTNINANVSSINKNSQHKNLPESLNFLVSEYAHTEGFISVVAIKLDGTLAVQTADTKSISELQKFIDEHNGKRNLYFSVNPLKTQLKNKASKNDVKSLAFLHVDVDPRDAYPIEEERTRIKKLIDDFEIPPSIIIDSGGGYQCFWRIFPTVMVEGNISKLEEYNQRLAEVLDGDSCHSIDHLMRLPGTLNLPTAKKKEKGRKPTPATLLSQSEQTYSLEDFDWLPPAQGSKINVVEKIIPSEIPDSFWDSLKTNPILNKRWEGEKTGLQDNSRSGMDMSLASLLHNEGLSKPEIATILLEYKHGKAKESGTAYINCTLSKLSSRKPELKVESLTDVGNAKQLVNLYGDDMRYCHSWKKWVIWDDKCWHIDNDGEIIRRAKRTIREFHVLASKQDDDIKRRALSMWAIKSENKARIDAMIVLAQSEEGISIKKNQLDLNPLLMGIANGVLDLKTGLLRKPDRKYYITKSTPILFDSQAECPVWLNFLNQTFSHNQAVIDFVQRAVGYSLTGETKEECIFLLHGEGANGKTTFLNTIRQVTGNYGVQCAPETLMKKRDRGIANDIARLDGARFVATSEVESGQRFAESLIKQLTGRDMIVARLMYSEYFEFEPKFKIWLAANHKPIIQGTDYAIWRRIKLIPFNNTVPIEKQDKNLADKLRNELPGILNWAINGCLSWQKNGLNEPEEVLLATREYKQEMDSVENWISECCKTSPASKGKASVLYDSYKDWASDSGNKPLSQKELSNHLKKSGYSKKKTKAGNFYIGINLNPCGT